MGEPRMKFVRDIIAKQKQPTAPLLTEAQAAKWFGVSPQTVARIRKAEAIEFIEVGNSIRYTMEQLNSYVEKQKVASCPKTASKSEASTSANTPAHPSGKQVGSTPPLDKHAALLSLQKSLKQPKKH